MGLIDRLANRLGYTPLTRELATEYTSAWSTSDTLAHIAFEDFYGAISPYIRTNRANAMTVGTIGAGRQNIAGTIGRLGLYAEQGGSRAALQPALLSQLERGVPTSTTLTWTADDLLFYPCAWWVVRERDFYGWPVWVQRVPHDDAKTDSEGRLIGIRDELVDAKDVIRFDSPNGSGLLVDGARTIKRAIAIELAAALAEDNPVPTIELHNEGDPLDADERERLLDAWASARRKRGVAYTPKNLKAIPHGQQPAQLLIEGRRALSLDLVRHMNLPAWAASTAVEGATMTYDNRQLRNWELIDLTLAPYFAAIGGRLSLPDVTPRGWTIKHQIDQLTQPDQKTRFETYEIGKRAGFIDNTWIAAQEGWPTVPEETQK